MQLYTCEIYMYYVVTSVFYDFETCCVLTILSPIEIE